jgi:hypothetical protein
MPLQNVSPDKEIKTDFNNMGSGSKKKSQQKQFDNNKEIYFNPDHQIKGKQEDQLLRKKSN